MKNKPVIFSKQIHSSFASLSSGDTFLRLQLNRADLDFNIVEGIKIDSKNKTLNGEVISEISENEFIIEVYLKAEKTFYERGLLERGFKNYEKTEEFNNLVNKYVKLGWKTESNYLSTKIYNEKSFLETQLRRYQGFVIPEWSNDLKPEDYQGALSDEVFNDKALQKYLEGGGCHGYIGHSARTYEIDREFERVAKAAGATNKQISNFLSHSAGRHYADQLDCKENVEKYFNEYFVWD